MIFSLMVLALPFQGNFGSDIVLPAIAGIAVLLMILNSFLNHMGYTLW